MNAYWLVTIIFMILIGTTCALLIKHYPPLRDSRETEFIWFCAFVLTVVGGLVWPIVIIGGTIVFLIWLLYSTVDKFINKRKGNNDAS
ncbi:hypothetical protein VBApiPXC38_70 [Acinetobacter phage VB_ApiP_XC38]|uniref:Uncharacterized protein n=1 Tax=Acinetobacter phage VB_ApiP_XC38 TaxID=2655002 RepID=A0A5P8PR36_9CAUD|nr:hypothetical protein KNU81_gp70 [Acinetobacter phage VB_ApiP_XC38]QFR59757.1 hypothetical protein VBApiPXC38_70 [Acinetobacter phage VB_ApiP_XC38]